MRTPGPALVALLALLLASDAWGTPPEPADPWGHLPTLRLAVPTGETGCEARAFFVNRVDQPFVPPGHDPEELIDRATELLGGSDEPERVAGFVRRLQALRDSRELSAERHGAVVERLREQAGGRPVFITPSVPAGQSPREGLLAIYLGLFASGD